MRHKHLRMVLRPGFEPGINGSKAPAGISVSVIGDQLRLEGEGGA